MIRASACGLGWRGRISGTTWALGTGQPRPGRRPSLLRSGSPEERLGPALSPRGSIRGRAARSLPGAGTRAAPGAARACAAAASERRGLCPHAALGVSPGRSTEFRQPKARGPSLCSSSAQLKEGAGTAPSATVGGRCPRAEKGVSFPTVSPAVPLGGRAARSVYNLLPPPRRSSRPQRQRGVGDTSRGPVPAAVSGGWPTAGKR